MSIFKLEDRILFEAGAAQEAVDAAQNVQDIQQQQAEIDAADNETSDLVNNAELAPSEQGAAESGDDAADVDAAQQSLVEGRMARMMPGPAENPADSGESGEAGGTEVSGDNAEESGTDADENSISATASANAADVVDASADSDLTVSDSVNGDESHSVSADYEQNVNDFVVAGKDNGAEDLSFTDVFPVDQLDATISTDGKRNELIVISGSIYGADEAIAELAERADVLQLEVGQDPMEEILAWMEKQGDRKYDAIHIVSHGASGYLSLNGVVIDAEYLAANPDVFAELGNHITDDGDIMLYGCNTAEGAAGEAFISQLAELTGADVAASTGTVGGYSGNWQLDFAMGEIDAVHITIDGYKKSLASEIKVNSWYLLKDILEDMQSTDVSVSNPYSDLQKIILVDHVIYDDNNDPIPVLPIYDDKGVKYEDVVGDGIFMWNGALNISKSITIEGDTKTVYQDANGNQVPLTLKYVAMTDSKAKSSQRFFKIDNAIGDDTVDGHNINVRIGNLRFDGSNDLGAVVYGKGGAIYVRNANLELFGDVSFRDIRTEPTKSLSPTDPEKVSPGGALIAFDGYNLTINANLDVIKNVGFNKSGQTGGLVNFIGDNLVWNSKDGNMHHMDLRGYVAPNGFTSHGVIAHVVRAKSVSISNYSFEHYASNNRATSLINVYQTPEMTFNNVAFNDVYYYTGGDGQAPFMHLVNDHAIMEFDAESLKYGTTEYRPDTYERDMRYVLIRDNVIDVDVTEAELQSMLDAGWRYAQKTDVAHLNYDGGQSLTASEAGFDMMLNSQGEVLFYDAAMNRFAYVSFKAYRDDGVRPPKLDGENFKTFSQVNDFSKNRDLLNHFSTEFLQENAIYTYNTQATLTNITIENVHGKYVNHVWNRPNFGAIAFYGAGYATDLANNPFTENVDNTSLTINNLYAEETGALREFQEVVSKANNAAAKNYTPPANSVDLYMWKNEGYVLWDGTTRDVALYTLKFTTIAKANNVAGAYNPAANEYFMKDASGNYVKWDGSTGKDIYYQPISTADKNRFVDKAGALYFDGANLTVNDSAFVGTVSNAGGAVLINSGNATFNNTIFSGLYYRADGTFGLNDGTNHLVHRMISYSGDTGASTGNTARGGAIIMLGSGKAGGDLTLTNTRFEGIASWDQGGGIYYANNDGDITMTNIVVDNVVSGARGNADNDDGGFLFANAKNIYVNVDTDVAAAGQGHAVSATHSVNTFTNIDGRGSGGVFYVYVSDEMQFNGDVRFENITFQQNNGRGSGGVIYFRANSTQAASVYGGNLTFNGNATFINIEMDRDSYQTNFDGNWVTNWNGGGLIKFMGQDLSFLGSSFTVDGVGIYSSSTIYGGLFQFLGNDLTIRSDISINDVRMSSSKTNAQKGTVAGDYGLIFFQGRNLYLEDTGAAAVWTVTDPATGKGYYAGASVTNMHANGMIRFSGYEMTLKNIYIDNQQTEFKEDGVTVNPYYNATHDGKGYIGTFNMIYVAQGNEATEINGAVLNIQNMGIANVWTSSPNNASADGALIKGTAVMATIDNLEVRNVKDSFKASRTD